MKRKLLAASLFVLTGVTVCSQSGSDLSGDRVGRIDRLLQYYVDDGRIAGAVALVLSDGRPVYERAVGWSDKEAGRRMTSDTIFRIASQTKAVTSVAVLSLMEEGKIGLTDPVSRFIPAFASTTVSVRNGGTAWRSFRRKRPITIRDLLTHTSGISYGTSRISPRCTRRRGWAPPQAVAGTRPTRTSRSARRWRRLAALPFVAQPGEAWVYGYSIDVLGCVVERASGMPLDEFVRTRITEPLGMKDTLFLSPNRENAIVWRRSTPAEATVELHARLRAPEVRARTWTAHAAASPGARVCCRPHETTRGSSR